jgi:hypothetical protein
MARPNARGELARKGERDMDVLKHQRAVEEYEALVRAIGHLEAARSSKEARQSWQSVLSHFQRLYNKLMAAAKGNAAASRWIEDRTRERRSEPLLQYLHQARHVDEHGIGEVAEDDATWSLMPAGTTMHVERLEFGPDSNGELKVLALDATHEDGRAVKVEEIFSMRHLMLVPIMHRSVTYEIPASFRGHPIGQDIQEVAELVRTHAQMLIEEAERFVGR